MSLVTIVDYGLANIRSVANAFEALGADVAVAQTGSELADAERIVLPGVGSFDAGMLALRERGHEEALGRRVLEAGVPTLGICLGLQFLFNGSDEGVEAGLGWLPVRIRRFASGSGCPKVPHMGWNETAIKTGSGLFEGFDKTVDFYYLHSYYAPIEEMDSDIVIGTCGYGIKFAAALSYNNIHAMQFHPEKSQVAGMKALNNFLALT